MEFDYKKILANEIGKFTEYDMQYAIEHDLDLTDGVIQRIAEYQEKFKLIKFLLRIYWGQIAYTIDHPEEIIEAIGEVNPELLEVEGAKEYIEKQIKKVGYRLYDYLEPVERVKVKLDKKYLKYIKKKEKKKKN